MTFIMYVESRKSWKSNNLKVLASKELKGPKKYTHSRRARNWKGLSNIAIVGEQETQRV
jgi:hypothetical protein